MKVESNIFISSVQSLFPRVFGTMVCILVYLGISILGHDSVHRNTVQQRFSSLTLYKVLQLK